MPSAWTLLLVAAAAAQPLSFTIDASAPITATPLNLPLLDCVGVGHAALMLRADLQEHLRNVQRDIGFARIRGHGILNDDMSVWLGGSVNMYNVFRVLDVLLALTPPMHPILELSFMPDDLAYDRTHTIMHYKGGTSAPRDFAQWERFIGDFVQLIVDRYGIATVQQFRFEAWNEPAYCGFYCPPPNVTNLDS
jgi:xylan 1,4-beta-xylosidase